MRKIVKSSGCIIVSNNKVLICHTARKSFSPHMWGIPKGHIDNGESSLKAAIRETKEETGLDLLKLNGKTNFVGTTKYKPFKDIQKYLDGWLFECENDITDTKLYCSSMVENGDDSFPEVDKFHWLDLSKYKNKMHYTSEDLVKKSLYLLKS